MNKHIKFGNRILNQINNLNSLSYKSFSYSFSKNNQFLSHNTHNSYNTYASRPMSIDFLRMNLLYKQSLFNFRSKFTKRNQLLGKNVNYKMRDRKTLRKRLRIVGPSFYRHFLFKRTHFHHKRVKKTRANKNKPKYKLVSFAMTKYIKRNLPNFKLKKCKLGRQNK